MAEHTGARRPAGQHPVLDVHAHAAPLPLLEWLQAEGLADLSRLRDEVLLLDPRISGVPAGTPLPLPVSMYGGTERLVELEEAGVDVQAVSLPPYLMASACPDRDLVAEVVGRGNNTLAEYVFQAPDYLLALGGVPVGWPDGAAEAVRCLDALGMHGLTIGTRGGAAELDAPVNEPLWELLAARQVFTFLHPAADSVPEVAVAAARLVSSGVVARHRFPLCLAHGGGGLPALHGRLTLGWEAAGSYDMGSHDALFFDTAGLDPVQLRRLVEDVGAGRVLAGTGYPFNPYDPAVPDIAATVAAVLTGDPAEAVLGGTAARLLHAF